MSFNDRHVQEFLEPPFQPREFASAKTPQNWVRSHLDRPVACFAELPSDAQTRDQVYATCRNDALSLEHRFICAMAWGSQRRRNARLTWANWDRLAKILALIFEGGMTREHAYELFRGKGAIKGLGPAYFTKLLFFFSPEKTFYIMDQWTAKSINYLADEEVVVLAQGQDGTDGPSSTRNSGATYARYCKMVDELSQLNCPPLTGEQTEQKLFCSGSPDVGKWRAIIRAAYPKRTARPVRSPGTPTKTSIAWAIYRSDPDASRAEVIQRFITEAKLTPKGASTYYANFRKKAL
jgi:hypothetical protein